MDKINSDIDDTPGDFAEEVVAESQRVERGATRISDKSLKTVNARRIVPIHPALVDLGLIEYIDVLRESGYERLFPELRHYPDKGYGKAASSWFNERFLGNRLVMERNSRKVFHSFRHNFDTALERLNAPDKAIRQLMGHSSVDARTSSTAPGYSHPRSVEELAPVIQLLNPELPLIARFKSAEGLIAVKHALKLKEAHQRPGQKT